MAKKPKNRDYLKSRQRAKFFEKQKPQVKPDFESMELIQIDKNTWKYKPKTE